MVCCIIIVNEKARDFGQESKYWWFSTFQLIPFQNLCLAPNEVSLEVLWLWVRLLQGRSLNNAFEYEGHHSYGHCPDENYVDGQNDFPELRSAQVPWRRVPVTSNNQVFSLDVNYFHAIWSLATSSHKTLKHLGFCEQVNVWPYNKCFDRGYGG